MHSTGIAGLDNTGRYCLLCLAVIICAIGNPAHGRDFGAIDKILTDSLPAVGGGCAVMLLTADSVVYKKGYGTFAANPDTVVAIASATKWISAAVLGSIIADGLLNFDDSIGTYLPQMSTHNKGGITLQQCFSHTAGMKGLTNYLYNPLLTLQQVADSIALENLNPAALPAGTKFFYGGLSMQVAGRVAEVIDAHPWDTVFARRIGRPLGMSRTQYFVFNDQRETDNPTIGGGIRSTLSDCGSFVRMLLNNGMYHGEQILPSHIVKSMENSLTENVALVYSPYQEFEQLDAELGSSGYGFGVWRAQAESYPEIEYLSQGATGFAFWINRAHGYGAVVSVEGNYRRFMATFVALKKRIRDAMVPESTKKGGGPVYSVRTALPDRSPQTIYTLLGKKIDIHSLGASTPRVGIAEKSAGLLIMR